MDTSIQKAAREIPPLFFKQAKLVPKEHTCPRFTYLSEIFQYLVRSFFSPSAGSSLCVLGKIREAVILKPFYEAPYVCAKITDDGPSGAHDSRKPNIMNFTQVIERFFAHNHT
jgi:hypothetical protein